MALKTSPVYRCLDKKTLIFGFELIDVFLIFTVIAILNFILAGVPYKFFWTWGPVIAMALALKLGKAGKPDNYIVHLLRFHFTAGVYSAFPLAPRRKQFVQFFKGA